MERFNKYSLPELEEQLKRMENNQTPRNYQTGTLYQLLCDRYGVNYYTKNERLIELVTKELSE